MSTHIHHDYNIFLTLYVRKVKTSQRGEREHIGLFFSTNVDTMGNMYYVIFLLCPNIVLFHGWNSYNRVYHTDNRKYYDDNYSWRSESLFLSFKRFGWNVIEISILE